MIVNCVVIELKIATLYYTLLKNQLSTTCLALMNERARRARVRVEKEGSDRRERERERYTVHSVNSVVDCLTVWCVVLSNR